MKKLFTILGILAVLSAIFVFAAKPNPGHNAAEISGGTFSTNDGAFTFMNFVGIGATPTDPLHVEMSDSNTVARFINTDTASGYGLLVKAGGTSAGRYSQKWQDADGNDKVTFLANGNVGIGTTGPASKIFTEDTPVLELQSPTGKGTALVLDGQDVAEGVIRSNGEALFISSAGATTGSNNAIVFQVEDSNSQYSPTERMRILYNGNIDMTGQINQDSWSSMSLSSGWTNFGGADDSDAQFFKDKNGVVHLRGKVYHSGATGCGSRMYRMPAGYRAGYELHWITSGSAGTCRMRVIDCDGFSGACLMGDNSCCGSDSSSYLYLDGITYRAEN